MGAMRGARVQMVHAVAVLGVVIAASAAITCGGDDEEDAAPAGGAATSVATAAASAATGGAGQVAIASMSFGAPVRVKAGAQVTWTNRDGVPHTVTADDGSFKSGNLAQGATFSHEFAKAGTFAYKCSIHSTMAGSVVVE